MSYWSCFVFFCRRFWRFFTICFHSPSCVVRCLLLQFICLQSFILSLGPCLHPMCLAQDTSLYLCCQFHAQFRFVLARFKFHIFRFVVFHCSQVHQVWLYDYHLRRVLVASYRPPFVLIRSYIWIQAALLLIAAPAKE